MYNVTVLYQYSSMAKQEKLNLTFNDYKSALDTYHDYASRASNGLAMLDGEETVSLYIPSKHKPHFSLTVKTNHNE